MGLLADLGLRRTNEFDRPTLVDEVLESPVQFAVSRVYRLLVLLRAPFQQLIQELLQLRLRVRLLAGPAASAAARLHRHHDGRSWPPVRVVCLSDTHDQTVAVPAGDVLIHAGDLTNAGTAADIQRQLDWLASLPHTHKVVVCGNHDSWFDPASRRAEDGDAAPPDFRGMHYLEHSSVALRFGDDDGDEKDGGRTLKIYGAPDIPQCGGSDFAFQYPRHLPPWHKTIPEDTDILVTHAPPKYHRDLGLGCYGLLQEVWRVRPRLHVFGHIHWGKGAERAYFDESQRAYESLMARPRNGLVYDLTDGDRLLDALQAVLYGFHALVASAASRCLPRALVPHRLLPLLQQQQPADGCLMVNAAQMHGNSGRMGRTVDVVVM